MEQFLREWRTEALNKNQHDSAMFLGDKLLALTSECYPYFTSRCPHSLHVLCRTDQLMCQTVPATHGG